jgi:hypothetical protein
MRSPDSLRDPDRQPDDPGGNAGERWRQFEEERGLSQQRELDLDELVEDAEPDEDIEEPTEGEADEPEQDWGTGGGKPQGEHGAGGAAGR